MSDQTTRAPRNEPSPPSRADVIAFLPLALFVVSLLVAYGYEIFSFNLTIDEEATAAVDRLTRAGWSVGEGRWTMAAFALLIPSPVVPVVSTALGVGLAGATWWILARRYLDLGPWWAAVAASVAGTIPVLAFIFSFSTVAWIIGIGHVLVLGFVAGTASPRWRWRIAGTIAGAAAIGVYDTFLLVIALLALVAIVRRPLIRTALVGVGAVVVAFLLSRLIGFVVSLAAGSPITTYTSAFLDIPGFFSDPVARTAGAVGDVAGTFMLTGDRFGLSSPWLAILTAVLVVAALVSVIAAPGPARARVVRIIAFIALLAVPFVIEALSVVVVFRSMIYLPILVLALASIAHDRDWRTPARATLPVVAVVASLAILTVVGNAMISNRLFSVAATTYALDQQLAFQIGQEKDRLIGDPGREVPLVVNGLHGWPSGVFTGVHETFGLSFFDLNADRTRDFLDDHGVLVREPTAAEAARVEDALAGMPVYPEDGWMGLDHGVLVLNFGTGG